MSVRYLDDELRRCLDGRTRFEDFMALQGETFRALEGRATLRFRCGERSYFIKMHRGIGWAEIFKNLFSLRLPVLGATNEWRALRYMQDLSLRAPRAVAYGTRGCNPARRESFLVTEDLGDVVSLEELCMSWAKAPPTLAFKRALIERVADIAQRMHRNGLNHRDFYLCHFMLPRGAAIGAIPIVIDLHRAQLRRATPRRWIVKDLAGLYFSSMDIGLQRRDLCRFIERYSGLPLREALAADARLWRDVARKAAQLYRKVHGRVPPPA